MRNKLDQAFLKLEETEKKLLDSDDFDTELMRQVNESMKEVGRALDDYYKEPSFIKRAFRLLF